MQPLAEIQQEYERARKAGRAARRTIKRDRKYGTPGRATIQAAAADYATERLAAELRARGAVK